jgi:hypothetical protein
MTMSQYVVTNELLLVINTNCNERRVAARSGVDMLLSGFEGLC